MKRIILFLLLAAAARAETEPSLEDLLDTGLTNPPRHVDASAASKFSQSINHAPSAVRVLSHEEIQQFGYRTLGEVLRSMPGLYTSYDYQNTFLGARGIAVPGDYNTRILILIDGIRINNNVFDSAFVGNEFPLDVDLIDRVEYAPGPGSAIYGNNAFLGVVNVITRGASSLRGSEAAVEYGSFDSSKLRASVASRLENGVEFLLSASRFNRGGPSHAAYMDYSVPAPDLRGSPAVDDELSQSVLAKLAMGPLQLTAVSSRREKGNPVLFGYFDAPLVIMNGRSVSRNDHHFIGLAYEFNLFKDWEIQANLNYHQEEYTSTSPFYLDPATLYLSKEKATGHWWDGEIHAVYNQMAGHRLLAGAEARINTRQYWHSYIEDNGDLLLNQQNSQRFAVFAQDEIDLTRELTLVAGARYDQTEYGNHINPRLGLIWNPQEKTNFKLLYGTAFRNPNFFESSQNNASDIPEASAENITTIELTAEHYIAPAAKINSSVYSYTMDDLIGQGNNNGNLVFVNMDQVKSYGWENELEYRFGNGIRSKLSYAWQKTMMGEYEVFNSPRHMVNFKWLMPLFDPRWTLASEIRYISSRTITSGSLPPQWLADMNINGELSKNCTVSLSVHNLADVQYEEATRLVQFNSFAAKQDGRDIRLKISLRY